MDTLKPEPLEPVPVSEVMIDEALRAMLANVDAENGGFGAAPKFPMPGALEFLIRRSVKSEGPSAGNAARRMLEAMAAGGFHDHLGGGFHRYSVDEAWTVPHFEKMADDNAGLLRNYVDGYAVFGDVRFRTVAQGIITFTREVLSDPEGGFYASQDADVTPDDEGGYFTWTDEDFTKALAPEEYPVLKGWLLHDRGGMHHDPAKKVLFLDRPVEAFAESLGKEVADVQRIIGTGKKKLLAERIKRQTPFIDRTLYTSLNGMLIAAYFHAYAVIGDEEIRTFAIRSLERILKERLLPDGLLHAQGIPAVLDDYVNLIDALIAAYEAVAEPRYLTIADELMSACLGKFYDHERGGFFDTETEVLGTRLKTIEDVPHASANAVAILALLKLAAITGKDEYRGYAEQTLKFFAGFAREIGAHAGAYFVSLDAFYRMVTLTVEAAGGSRLAQAARALIGTYFAAIRYGNDNKRIIPCRQGVCFEPVSDPALLPALF